MDSARSRTVSRAGAPAGGRGYAEEVAAFNVSRQHTPDVVVAPRSADDVAAAVRWAGEHDAPGRRPGDRPRRGRPDRRRASWSAPAGSTR